MQALYLVFPGTTGSSSIDYHIVDRNALRIEVDAKAFTEKLVLLPGTYQVNYYPGQFKAPEIVMGDTRLEETWHAILRAEQRCQSHRQDPSDMFVPCHETSAAVLAANLSAGSEFALQAADYLFNPIRELLYGLLIA